MSKGSASAIQTLLSLLEALAWSGKRLWEPWRAPLPASPLWPLSSWCATPCIAPTKSGKWTETSSSLGALPSCLDEVRLGSLLHSLHCRFTDDESESFTNYVCAAGSYGVVVEAKYRNATVAVKRLLTNRKPTRHNSRTTGMASQSEFFGGDRAQDSQATGAYTGSNALRSATITRSTSRSR